MDRFLKRFLVLFASLSLFLIHGVTAEPGPGDPPLQRVKKENVSNYFSRVPSRIFRNLRDNAQNLNPEQMEEVIASSQSKTFEGDPNLREENSSILRPIKQVALKVLDGEVGIIRSFLSFQGASFIKSTLSNSNSIKVLGKARQVLNAMSPAEITRLNRAAGRLDISKSIMRFSGKMGPGLRSFVQSEGNFALMSVIGALISMGIYDGLDVSTMKDKVLALDPLTTNNTVSHSLVPSFFSQMSMRHFYRFFNNRFDAFYDKMLQSSSFGSSILKDLELKADVIGAKLSKSHRLGIHKNTGESLAKKLGLVGVGEGTKFALKDFFRSISTGLAFGLAANVVADSVFVGIKGYENSTIIGGNRNERSFRPEYNSYLFQKSGNSVQDWVNERKFALKDVWDSYRKTPLTKVVSSVTGFTGAYLGSVVAGALLVGGGIPAMVGGVMIASVFGGIGDFVGRWATTKFERSDSMKNFRRSLVETRLVKIIGKMEFSSRNQLGEEEIRSLARERSQDMSKRESMGQVYNRIFLVEEFSHVQLYQSGEYINMKVDRRFGEEFDMQAHIRYDLVNIHGQQGIWDMKTNQIFDVGSIAKNNGFRVVLISDDEKISVEGNKLLSKEGSDFRVLSNGLLMTKSDYDANKWVIKGQNLNSDLFLRNRRARFTWDSDSKSYLQVDENQANGPTDPLKPLMETFNQVEENGDKGKVFELIKSLVTQNKDKLLKKLETMDGDQAQTFLGDIKRTGVSQETFQNLEEMGSESWRTLLRGKVYRGTDRTISDYLEELIQQDNQGLKLALEAELENPHVSTVWDKLRDLISPEGLAVSFIR